MKKNIYLKLQLKRAFKYYPSVLIVTFLALFAIVAAAAALIHINNSENKQKVNIGIVGNVKDSRVDVAVYALDSMDEAIPFVNFVELSESEAEEALDNNDIVGYINIPDDYFVDIAYGDNTAAKYVTSNGRGDLGNVLTNELAVMVSDMVTETQRAIYSAIKFAEDNRITEGLGQKIDELNFEYMRFVLNRQQTYEVEYLGIKDKLTYGGYYICGFLVFFLMIWGISCAQILSSKNYGLSRTLYTRGMKTHWQILCEYAGYFIITFITFLLIAVIMGLVVNTNDFGIRELVGANMFSLVGFVFKIIPVMLMFTFMQFMLYEIFNNIVSSVLVQFIIAVGLGYVSGCFYPNTFFPEAVQKVTSFLPSGAGFSYVGKMLTDEQLGTEGIVVAVYLCLFAFVTVWVRNCKLKGDALR